MKKSLDPWSKDSHRLSLLQGFPSAWPRKSKLHYLDVLHGRLLGSLVNFHLVNLVNLWKDSWGLPMRAKSSKQRCPALCLYDLSYNVKYHWSCRVGGCYSHLTASGSWQGFPGVDHEGHQDSAILRVIYTSFYSLASTTRIDAVELILRKFLLLWWSFCV